MAIVCSLHQITEQNTPTNKTGTQNQHFTCQLNMSSMCPLAVALRTRQSFVSVHQLGRNFDDGRPSAEGHPRWHNQPGSNPSYSVAICLPFGSMNCTFSGSHAARNAVGCYRNYSLDGATLFSKLIQVNYDIILRMK